jgi:superfamily I DNA/RNA helicase
VRANTGENALLDRTSGLKGEYVVEDELVSAEEAELRAAIEAVLRSPSRKKLVIAGPGTGKTRLFKEMLELASGEPDQRVVLTLINNLKDDLEKDLDGLAQVFTLHSYCLGLLHRDPALRGSLSPHLRCCPGLASLIADDWELINVSKAPQFVGEMRGLAEENHIQFYLARSHYYDAVDFDDSVYRAFDGLSSGRAAPDSYDLVLIDEYQDFNALEAGVIGLLGERNPIVIAGDDDQALYSQLRGASWDYIRLLSKDDEFEVFELPFCMRCPKVVVDAVADVIVAARRLHRLEGRIDKPYKHFPPVKGAASAKYPKIANVKTSVQSTKANYMGRYIAQAISEIPQDEIQEAARGGYPPALVIVARPYRDQIIGCLQSAGHAVHTRRESGSETDREMGLSILKEKRDSNLGWRIVLGADRPRFLRDVIVRTADSTERLVDAVPAEYRDTVLAQVDAYEPRPLDEGGEEPSPDEKPPVRVESFEGAKGLSAQHVFIAGLHDGELPHNPAGIKDLEICKFLVGLTRTRKKCTLIHTGRFGGSWRSPSSFISWIDDTRLDFISIDKTYWTKQPGQGEDS